jgi:hypothetical protein
MDVPKDTLQLMPTDKVRETLGDSYGVSLQNVMSDSYSGFGSCGTTAIGWRRFPRRGASRSAWTGGTVSRFNCDGAAARL